MSIVEIQAPTSQSLKACLGGTKSVCRPSASLFTFKGAGEVYEREEGSGEGSSAIGTHQPDNHDLACRPIGQDG